MRKALLILVACHLSLITCVAQIRWNQTYQQYIDQYKDVAIEQMKHYGIPASITLAQGIFESGAGQMAGQVGNHITTMMNGESASGHTTMPTSRLRITRSFFPADKDTVRCSN